MHTVRFLLRTTEHDRQVLEKRFHAVSHVHNVMVKHAKNLLKRLSHNGEYLKRKAEYAVLLKKEKLSKEEKVLKKELSARMDDIIKETGLSESAFESYLKVCGKQFSKCLSSQQVQKEAARVWRGVKDVLYGKGEEIHFKKYRDFDTICGKNNTNGAKFDRETYTVDWLGLALKCKVKKDDVYIAEALDAHISYCEIKRLMFPNGWHYYAILYLRGDAPKKIKAVGDKNSPAGLDMGTSTVAVISENAAVLEELAPQCKKYNKQIEQLLRRMDASKRMTNPDKYNPDGTINKTRRDRWVYSKTYLKNRDRLKYLYTKKAAYTKQSHEMLANRLLADAVNFIMEKMSFKALSRRAKKTERREEPSVIKKKNGNIKQVKKFKRKKRFGRSLNNRAPAEFVAILKRKAKLYGGDVYEVNTKKFRASQYDHAADEYIQIPLTQREKTIDGHYVQRDLYSAFLLKNADKNLNRADREKCIYEFKHFLKLQDELITEMKNSGISMKYCFGF